ncbi:MAG: phosphoribosyl-AMP cyclohydrolase [Rikenellaceae bacterium]
MVTDSISLAKLDFAKSSDGLIPVIIQDDHSLEVLMMGYMNKEAYIKSITDGRVTFYSRTRSTLWTKGETSGHYLNIVKIYSDCDDDTLLIRVVPIGPTCHTGARSCFHLNGDTTEGAVRKLYALIQQEYKLSPDSVKQITQALCEDCTNTTDVALSGNYDTLITKTSDLIYHLIQLMDATGKSIKDIESEISERYL